MVWVFYIVQNIIRTFNATDENVNEMRDELSRIGQKVDVHVVTIKHLELQMNRFSTIVNPHKPSTLPINTI